MATGDKSAVTKSALVARITRDQPHLSEQDVELAVNSILERMIAALVSGERIEIRGFGSMCLRYRVRVPEKYVPHFKPGAALRRRVNAAAARGKSAERKP